MPPWPSEGARRVPLAVYTDPAVHQRELQRVFRGPAWQYVGLAAEVPEPGDFMQGWVGDTPVILVRDRDRQLRVFVNRCTHRGAQVCQEARGSARVFTCPYHQWSFGLDGSLAGIPFRRGIAGKGGMSACFDPAEHSLEQLNVAERHGVVFASHAHDIEPLDEYLGPTILAWFDRVCDGRPLKVIGSMQHRVHCNWKLQVENLKDPFHAALLHSFFVTFGIWRADQETRVEVDPSGRHSVLVSTASFKRTGAGLDHAGAAAAGFRLEDTRLIAHEREYEHGTGAILTVWPNLIVLQQMNCLAMRHVRPDGPGACVKSWTFFGYESDTPEMLQRRLAQANLLGPSGLVTIDDNEVLAISQAGAAASAHHGVAVLEAGEGTGSADHMLTECAIRGFHQHYRRVMGDDAC